MHAPLVLATLGWALATRPTVYRRVPVLVSSAAEGDAARRLQAAITEAGEARNAEARLRNMIRSANMNAEALAEERDELRDELDALRTLYDDDTAALQATIDELEGKEFGATDTSGGGPADKLREEVKDLSARLTRAELEASDLRDELAAVRELSEREVAASEEAAAELAVELREARARPSVADVESRESELEEQVSQLLETIAGQDEGLAELMSLRPRVSALEAELRDAKAALARFE